MFVGNNSKTVNNISNLTWSKDVQQSKIYLPCNFEVNLITHLDKHAILPYVLFLATAAMLVGSRYHRAQF
jgi:hypothetical protein